VTNAIELHNITRTFGRSTALDGVTVSIPDGSICGLLGRNGAGKTTIMSIIAGQDRPTSGRVEVLGERPFENEAVLSRISFVRDNQRYPDNYRLHHVLRIAPDFAPNWNADVANELVDGFRIPARTPIKKFSRGQLSSVAIVLGLASRAPVTLLDEPYLGLDITARAMFHDVLLRDYSERPRTVLLSTHLIEESEALFDRVVIVDQGRIRADVASDATGELAFTLSGTTDAVDELSANQPVLRVHAVTGLKSVTIEGQADDALLERAEQLGARVGVASLPDLVVAFGAGTPDSSRPTTPSISQPAAQKGVRA
jgi:ABC-2 type transport system ATP-binding protein